MQQFFIIIIFLLLPYTARACRDDQVRVARENTADTVTRLREVIVTASAPTREVTATAPTHRLTATAMETAGVTDIADALHRLPGITLRDYGGAGGLKTVSVRGLGAGHTAVIYDGLPLSDMQTGQIDLSRYSLDNVDNISLVIGDNENIFSPARIGASATTLAIAPVSAPDSLSLTAKLRSGSFGLINPFVRFNAPVGRGVSLNGAAEYTHTRNNYPFTIQNGDFTEHARRTNSKVDCGHAEAGMDFTDNAGTNIAAKVYYYDNSRQLPGPVVLYNPVNREHLRERNAFGQVRLGATPAERWMVRAAAKFNWAASNYRDIKESYPGGKLVRNYYQREAYATGCALWMPTNSWSASYAADYFYNSLNSNQADDRRPWRHSVLQALSGRFRNRRVTATGRLLLSVYRNGAERGAAAKDATRLSPSVGVSVKPVATHNLFLRASYKEIFRMPTFNEVYFDHFGSTDLLPENTRQLNLGATFSAMPKGRLNRLTATADGYMNLITDMIVAVPYNMFIWRVVNLSKVRVFGLDVTVSAEVSPAKGHYLTLDATYSLQRAQPRTDPTSSEWMKQVAYTPRHSGSVSLGWDNPWVCLSVHATGVSERFTTNNNLPSTRIPGYIEAGATARRSIPLGRCTMDLRLDLINAFNHQYAVVAYYPMPGRSWQATITVNI